LAMWLFVFSLSTSRFNPRGKSPRYPLGMTLDGTQRQSGRFREETHLFLFQERTTIPRLSSAYPSHYFSWAFLDPY